MAPKTSKQASLGFKSTKPSVNRDFKVVKPPQQQQHDIKTKDIKPPTVTVESIETTISDELEKEEVDEINKLPNLDPSEKIYSEEALKIAEQSIAPDVHPENVNDCEKILKNFDFTIDYGPVAGLTRLERWERANKLGLNPPAVVKKILVTKQGETENVYKQSYLYGQLV
ncbi:DNA polymerase delta subunit 4 [Yarrowia sp. C11]|nr:DNA polymerase delta subunit 4 [Yarrowia sp. E02]KAG5372549.1 DNA polymerase delta subunit 4 [Yarrowia sp. C11]